MKVKAPLITLAAGLVVAGVIYALNVDLSNDVARNNAGAAASAVSSVTAAATSQAPSEPPSSAPSSAPPIDSAPVVGDGSGNAAKEGMVTYGGSVNTGVASLAIVVRNGKTIAYVCDGKKIEAWLNGSMANGIIELSGAKGTLKGTYGNGQVKGEVTAGGKTWGFTVKPVTAPSGLYRTAAAARQQLDASWVVLPDFQIGVALTNGEPGPAPAFDVNAKSVTVGGAKVAVESSVPA